MKKGLVFLLASMILIGVAFADVDVTYRINTSTITDIGVTDSTYQIQVCGSEVGPPGDDRWLNIFLTWDDTSPLATNVAGDYWELTITYPDSMIGWRMAYKVRYKGPFDAGFNWESLPDNRMYNLPAADTSLAIAYVNNNWDPPYSASDSVDVYFRVNMSGLDTFDPATDKVYIVGNFPHPDGSANMWVPDKYPLTAEGNGIMWGYDLKLPVAGAPYDSTMYRFTLGSWGESEAIYGTGMFPTNENRGASVRNDTTIAWVWWNNVPAIQKAHEDTMIVTWQADMSKAITNKGFSFGDTLEVEYAHYGTAKYSGALPRVMMLRQGISTIYAATDTVIGTTGDYLNYQYYLTKRGTEYREIYYNFFYTGTTQGEQERRPQENMIDGITIQDITDSQTEIHRMPIFRNTEEIGQDVLVTYTCDLRPAYYQVIVGQDTLDDIQGNLDVFEPEFIDTHGLAMNGPAAGGWGTWGVGLMTDGTRKMYDDGTHGDPTPGDSIYAVQFQYTTAANDVIGQEFKFGIGGGDNEGGEGGYGNNHIENIDDTQATATIESQFGSINPPFYWAWDYDNQMPSAVDMIDGNLPKEFALDRNYPNPFNPVTNILYHLPKAEHVTLTVYNILGEKILALVDQKQEAGSYKATWDGKNSRGILVGSGVYFYRLNAGDFSKTYKMLFLK